MRIRFDYIDFEGKKTTRTIRDIKIKSFAHVYAFCELSKGKRSFVIDKMINPFDMETNTPIDDLMDFLGILDESGKIEEEYLEEK